MSFLDRVRHWLAGSQEPFGSFVRDDGSPVLLDRATAKFLVSELPEPSQAALQQMLDQADRMRLIEGGCGLEPHGDHVLVELQGEPLRHLCRLLAIVDGEPAGHCMCNGDYAIEFLRGGTRLAAIGWHHGLTIRWQAAWSQDAALVDPEGLVRFLAECGVPGPRQEWEAREARARESRAKADRWRRFAPESIRDRENLLFEPFPNRSQAEELQRALAAEWPEPADQVEALLSWYGSTAPDAARGPHATYENLPRLMLDLYDADTLFAGAAAADDLTRTGACRYFLDADFAVRRFSAAAHMPDALRHALVDHQASSGCGRLSARLVCEQLPALLDRCPPALKPDLLDALQRPQHGDFIANTVARAGSTSELAAQLLRWLREVCGGEWLGAELWSTVVRVLDALPLAAVLDALGDDGDVLEGIRCYARHSSGERRAALAAASCSSAEKRER